MTIQYVAKDGTVFYDEDACKDYELELEASGLEGIVKFFNEDYAYIGYDIHALEEAFYCVLIEPKRLPQYLEYLKTDDYDLPEVTKPNTVYRWNFRTDKWENMTAIVEGLNNIIQLVKEEAGIYEN